MILSFKKRGIKTLKKNLYFLLISIACGGLLIGCGGEQVKKRKVKKFTKPKCMKSSRFFKGESQGSSRKQVLNDAVAEVVRQVQSKVESEVKSNCTSRSSQGFKCSDSVNVVVKSSFKYGVRT